MRPDCSMRFKRKRIPHETARMGHRGLTAVGLWDILKVLGAEVAEWQTRRTQNPVG